MEKFTAKIKRRITYKMVSALLLIPLGIYTLIAYVNSDGIIGGSQLSDFVGGFFNGVRGSAVLGVVFYQVITAIKYMKALKSPEKLSALQIEENDERLIAISEISGNTTLNISLFLIITACLISGLFNHMISVTLLFVFVVLILIRIYTSAYYEKKM